MTFSSTTTTRATSIRRPTLRLFRREPKQPPFDVSWSCGRICSLRYQAVLFLDDDVEIGAEGIDALFRAMTAEKLDLAQPALTADSATAYPFLKRPSAGAGVTRVSSVEIMAPALTRRALECAKWVFAESVSGWGADLLLGPAVRAAFGPNSVGVIGSVAVRHAAPVDLARRRLLRLSASLWRRSRARGQPDRGRLRRRTLSAAARARRSRRNLPSALTGPKSST